MKSLFLVGIVLIVSLGLLLKFHNYERFPQRGATSDEYTYSFMGVSLLTQGIPISWSYFYPYKYKYNLTINKLYFPMVYPYFDHPPLNGLIVGAFAIVRGENTFEKISLSTIRIIPIIFSSFSIIMLMFIAKKLYNYKTAIWAGLIYATSPLFSISGRVVVSENLLTLLFLIIILLFIHFKQKINLQKSLFLGVLCGLCFWTKEVGIVITIVLAFLFIFEKIKIRFLTLFIITSSLFVLGYIAYGFYFDREVFLEVLKIQSTRSISPESLRVILSTPDMINTPYYDAWYFLGFAAFFLALNEFKKHAFSIVLPFFYLLFLVISVTVEDIQGWYLIPFFPFLSLFAAYYILKSIQEKSWFLLVALLFVGVYLIEYLYKPLFGLTGQQFRILIFVLFVPFLVSYSFRKYSFYQRLGEIWFYVAILANVYLTYSYVHPA